MSDIKNKRISRDVIKKIVKMVYDRYRQLFDLHAVYENETREYNNPANSQIKDIVVHVKPTIELGITVREQTETRDDVEWFCQKLDENPREIEKIEICFFSSYKTSTTNNETYNGRTTQEDITMYIRPDSASIKFDFQNESESYNQLHRNIDALISQCPDNYDKTIAGSGIRKGLTGLSRSFLLGIILTLGLVLFCTYSNVNIYINSFVKGKLFVPICFLIFILIGFFIPGKNHANYNRLKMKKKYDGWNRYNNKNYYKNDVKGYLENCEVEIGEFYRNEAIRQEIETTFSNAKLWLVFEIIAFVALFIINLKI